MVAVPGPPHCPHCGVELPAAAEWERADPETADAAALGSSVAGEHAGGASDAVFCPSCGRRVEGWRTGFRASIGGASAGMPLPGSDEPTRAVVPTPSLLRAIEASKDPASHAKEPSAAVIARPSVTTDVVRAQRRGPLVAVLALALVAGLAAALILRRDRPIETPAPTPPPVVAAPVTAAPVTPAAPAAPVEPAKRHAKPQRISAPPITAEPAAIRTTPPLVAPSAAPALVAPPTRVAPPLVAPPVKPTPVATSTKADHGTLPHKQKGASKTADANDIAAMPSGTGTAAAGSTPVAATAPVMETSEREHRPMTEEEQRAEAASRADADGVRFVVRAHLPQVHACYSRAFKESSPGGRVDIGFVIGPTGKASKIRTEGNTTNSSALGKCLEQRIADWDFPRPSSGEFELIYPFVFSPGT